MTLGDVPSGPSATSCPLHHSVTTSLPCCKEVVLAYTAVTVACSRAIVAMSLLFPARATSVMRPSKKLRQSAFASRLGIAQGRAASSALTSSDPCAKTMTPNAPGMQKTAPDISSDRPNDLGRIASMGTG